MTFDELVKICQPLDVYGRQPDQFGSLTQDSRQVSEGSVFIAVRGTQVDGHMFIENAISRGASIIICEDSYYTSNTDICVLEVEDTRSLIGPLAQAFEGNPAEKMTLIGITGTNGKTTVATLVYQALKAMGEKPSLLGTVAKRIDEEVLESLLTTSDPIELASDMARMAEANSSHLVMEVSSHALDQERVSGLNFKVAAFTNLSHDHLDYHDTLDEYAATKKKLFDSLNTEAWAVINGDDPNAPLIIEDCPAQIIRYGFKQEWDVTCSLTSSDPSGNKLDIGGTEITSPLIGEFNAYNVASAFLICRVLGFKPDTIAHALHKATGAAGRLERVQVQGKEQPLVLVDYAHTPDALENVLESLKTLKTAHQKLHVIFGCGGDRDRTKRPKMAGVAERYADFITVTSDNPRNEDPDAIISEIMEGFEDRSKVRRITDREKAIRETIFSADINSIILIAGKGHESYQEIKGERLDFDDRKIAFDALDHSSGNSNPGEVA